MPLPEDEEGGGRCDEGEALPLGGVIWNEFFFECGMSRERPGDGRRSREMAVVAVMRIRMSLSVVFQVY